MTRRAVRQVVIHHTASAPTATLEEIRRGHLARGFREVGYHYLVRLNGRGGADVLRGRAEEMQGAHVKGRNADTIGVSMIGNYSESEIPDEIRTVAVELVAGICRRLNLPASAVVGHRELAATECPGRLVDLNKFRAAVAAELKIGLA